MKTKAHSINIPFIHTISTKALFYMLATLFVVLFVTYAYLVNKTIMNVVAREGIEKKTAALSSTIGELEFEYMAAQNGITLDLAYQKGFLDATPKEFIARVPGALSINN